MKSTPITVQYGQIYICDPASQDVGLLWGQNEVDQGFAWDPEMVAFGVPDHNGRCILQVEKIDHFYGPEANSLWALQVPFEVKNGGVMAGTILVDEFYEIDNGRYNVIFQTFAGAPAYAYVLKFQFVASAGPSFAILKTGTEIKTDKVLEKRAKRAAE